MHSKRVAVEYRVTVSTDHHSESETSTHTSILKVVEGDK